MRARLDTLDGREPDRLILISPDGKENDKHDASDALPRATARRFAGRLGARKPRLAREPSPAGFTQLSSQLQLPTRDGNT